MFPWQQDDVLLLDNMSMAHAREPYAGERNVVVAMTEAQTDSRARKVRNRRTYANGRT
jgi:alpha-ketoglutarate-dependent taurine dioxygenase